MTLFFFTLFLILRSPQSNHCTISGIGKTTSLSPRKISWITLKKVSVFSFFFFFWWVYNFVLHISWKFKVVLTPYWVYAGILSYPDLVPSKYPNNTFYIKTDFSKLIFSSMWSEILSKTFPLCYQCCYAMTSLRHHISFLRLSVGENPKKVEKLMTSSKQVSKVSPLKHNI